MATVSATPQTNGIPPSSVATASQTLTQGSTGAQTPSQPANPAQAAQPQPQHPQQSPTSPTSAPRPRDARTLELLLTAQGVTNYEARVPLLLLDFAYRHTSAILSDALHLSADPYITHAGTKASAQSGAAATVPGADASVAASAVQLAIANRLAYQFGGAGATSKEWLLELAGQRNRVGLPRVAPSEWGVRLPSERFVLNGSSWNLRDDWAGAGEGSEEEDEDDDMEMEDAMPAEDVGGDGVEGGTVDDIFGGEGEDEDMED